MKLGTGLRRWQKQRGAADFHPAATSTEHALSAPALDPRRSSVRGAATA
jgi:hypothetical protein